MSDLARRLRETREKRGLTLRQAEQATRIRPRYLDALEVGDFARLPDGLSARGFVRNYARWLGLDPAQALAEFEAEWGVIAVNAMEVIPNAPSRDRLPSRYTEIMPLPEPHYSGALPDEKSIELDLLADQSGAPKRNGHTSAANGALAIPEKGEPIYIDTRRDYSATDSSFKLNVPKSKNFGGLVDGLSTFVPGEGLSQSNRATRTVHPRVRAGNIGKPRVSVWRPILIAAGAVVTTLVVGLAAIFFGLPALNAALTARPTAVAAPLPAVMTVVAPGGAATASAPILAATTAVVAPLPGGGFQFLLDARERAWVRVTVDGRVLFEGIPALGPTAPWQAREQVLVETGNAGAFEPVLNGTRMGNLGARNIIVQAAFGPSGRK